MRPDAGSGCRSWTPGGSRTSRTTRTRSWLDDDTYEIEGDPEIFDAKDIGSYVGHGTFVAGVIRCLAPPRELEVEGVLKHAGAVYESDIAAELNEALTDKDHPQLISISAGTYTRNDAGLLAFELLSQVHRLGLEDDGPLVIAAAGNENTNRQFYPAAYDWVVAVGALDENLCAPRFTNYGAWVDVWAHGTNLVNAFPTGTYYVKEPGPAQGEQRDFTGLAQWSGTSFSTPIVTGAIAALMSETPGMTARQAKQALFTVTRAPVASAPKVPKGIAVGPRPPSEPSASDRDPGAGQGPVARLDDEPDRAGADAVEPEEPGGVDVERLVVADRALEHDGLSRGRRRPGPSPRRRRSRPRG